jgi:ABC-type multidrug transport system fused ATPase/permease subunit
MIVSGTDAVGSTAEALAESPAAVDTNVWQSVTGVTEALLDRAGGLVRIIALESRLAGLSLAYMLLLAVLSAVLMAGAWLLFNAAVAIWLAGNGWPILNAVLVLGAANLAALAAAILVLRRFSNNLLFTGSRTQLFTRRLDEAADAQA